MGSKGITETKYLKVLKGIGRGVIGLQAVAGGYSVFKSYSKTGSFTYSTQRAAARTIGGMVGGYIGASAGFVLGGPVGAGFGAVFVGAAFGKMGEIYGERSVYYYHYIKNRN